jgi:hypothetical protein
MQGLRFLQKATLIVVKRGAGGSPKLPPLDLPGQVITGKPAQARSGAHNAYEPGRGGGAGRRGFVGIGGLEAVCLIRRALRRRWADRAGRSLLDMIGRC